MESVELNQLRISIDHVDQAALLLLVERQSYLSNGWSCVDHSPLLRQKPNFQGQTGFYAQVLHFLNDTGKVSANVGVETIDFALASILQHRFYIVHQIHLLKQKLNMQPYVPERWQKLLNEQSQKAQSLGLSTMTVQSFLEILHQESLFIQQERSV